MFFVVAPQCFGTFSLNTFGENEGKDLLWRDEKGFIAYWKGAPDTLGAVWQETPMPNGQTLRGWRTEWVEPSGFPDGKHPKSILLIDLAFKSQVNLIGNFGTDKNLADIGASAKALSEDKLGIDSAPSSDAMLNTKKRIEEKAAKVPSNHPSLST